MFCQHHINMIKSSFKKMITTNYQTYGTSGFNLRLRIYQDGETRYVNVNKLLQGNLLKRHWNQKKQMFIPSAPFSEENNEALVQLKRKYDDKAMNWNGTLFNFIKDFNAIDTQKKPLMKNLLSDFIGEVKKRKHPDGTTKGSYEGYEKLMKRLEEFCAYKKIKWDKLLVEDFTADFINALFDWVDLKRKGRGKLYISTMLHSVLNHADKQGLFHMDGLKPVRWAKKLRVSAHKYHALTTPSVINSWL